VRRHDRAPRRLTPASISGAEMAEELVWLRLRPIIRAAPLLDYDPAMWGPGPGGSAPSSRHDSTTGPAGFSTATKNGAMCSSTHLFSSGVAACRASSDAHHSVATPVSAPVRTISKAWNPACRRSSGRKASCYSATKASISPARTVNTFTDAKDIPFSSLLAVDCLSYTY